MTYEGTNAVVDVLVDNDRQAEAIEHLLKEVQRLHWVCMFWQQVAEDKVIE